MKINYAYNHNGWIATDEEGNTATSTFAEGKEKAAERLTDTQSEGGMGVEFSEDED